MCRTATDGRHLANLVVDAAALCKAAQGHLILRTAGPGRPETFEQWQIAVLIFIAIARGRKSKSSQYRFLKERESLLLHDDEFASTLELATFPSRATYMRRYPKVYPLYEKAIELGGRRAIEQRICDARTVSADKSMIAARGRKPSKRVVVVVRVRGVVDTEAGWGRSAHDGWVWGYSYEVVVCSPKNGLVLPLLASAATNASSEHRTF